jgi:hypothetical protein
MLLIQDFLKFMLLQIVICLCTVLNPIIKYRQLQETLAIQ